MSKRDKRRAHHRGAAPLAGPDETRARVHALIATGKTREALELAKQLFKKETRSAEAQALVLVAYEARIGALLAKEQHQEASALAAVVGERFPAHRGRIATLVSRSRAIASGDLRGLIAELATADAPRRQEIESVLTRELRDPKTLADAEGLAADHPLRSAARAVAELFTAVTTGPLPDGALAALDRISRRSPLAPWKLLIRALDAYYQRDDGAVIANLDAIPADSGPARLVPVLRHLIGDPAPLDQRTAPIAMLVKDVTAGRGVIRGHMRRLVQALAAGDQATAVSAVERIVPLLALERSPVKRTFAVTVFAQWMRLGLNPMPLMQALSRDRRDVEWQRDVPRLLALTFERAGLWDEALLLWDVYLATALRAGVLPPTGPAPSGVLLHMAGLFPSDREEVLDAFDVDSDDELEEAIAAGERPECADRGRLLARARDADPSARAYRALVAHWEPRDARRAEVEAEAWRRAHPHDLEPLLYLARAAERRGAHRSALDLLDDAEAINRVHPEVRQSRFRLLLASAERRIREGRFAPALADLDRLDKETAATTGDTFAYLGALRAVAMRRNSDGAAAVALQEELAARLGNRTLLALILESVATAFGLEPPEATAPASQVEAIVALGRASELLRALERPITVPQALLAQVERDQGGVSPADLHALCEAGLAIGRPELTYRASGRGLAAGGPLLHRFLLARGRVLAGAAVQRDRDRAQLCLLAVRELAGRARDMNAVSAASAALETVTRSRELDPWGMSPRFEAAAPPTQEEIALLVAAELADDRVPRFASTKSGRKRKRSSRWQRDLFDS